MPYPWEVHRYSSTGMRYTELCALHLFVRHRVAIAHLLRHVVHRPFHSNSTAIPQLFHSFERECGGDENWGEEVDDEEIHRYYESFVGGQEVGFLTEDETESYYATPAAVASTKMALEGRGSYSLGEGFRVRGRSVSRPTDSYQHYPNALKKGCSVALAALLGCSSCVEAHVLYGCCSESFEKAEKHFRDAIQNIPQCFKAKELATALKSGDCWGCPPARAVYRARLGLANVLRKQGKYKAALATSRVP
eukprot:1192863-Prorocentrum_minimum.AAC.1